MLNNFQDVIKYYFKFQPKITKHQLYQQLQKPYAKDTTVLVKIQNNTPEYIANHNPENHGRFTQLKYLIQKLCSTKTLADTLFLVIINDGYSTDFPTFSAIRAPNTQNGNIPFPLGHERKNGSTQIENWDVLTNQMLNSHIKYPFENKIPKAIFRGKYCWQTWKVDKYGQQKSEHWTDCVRGKLYEKTKDNTDFDIGFTGKESHGKIPENEFNKIPTVDPLPLEEQQKYKYILNVGQNANWADRLRLLCFMNSAIFVHEGGSEEFFYKLLKPYIHYIPIKLDFSDIKEQVTWAKQNDEKVINIVKNMNEFAQKFLCEKAIEDYAYMAITKYSELLI